MKRVTLKFRSLQDLSNCMYELGVKRPVIDYNNYFLTADLTDAQIVFAKSCGAEVIEIIVMK